jgi:hypothetical protein
MGGRDESGLATGSPGPESRLVPASHFAWDSRRDNSGQFGTIRERESGVPARRDSGRVGSPGAPGLVGTPGSLRAPGLVGSPGTGRVGSPGSLRAPGLIGTPGTGRVGSPGASRLPAASGVPVPARVGSPSPGASRESQSRRESGLLARVGTPGASRDSQSRRDQESREWARGDASGLPGPSSSRDSRDFTGVDLRVLTSNISFLERSDVMRSYQGYYTRSHQNSEVKRLWAGIVLGWVTSREVPVLHPFSKNPNLFLKKYTQRPNQ